MEKLYTAKATATGGRNGHVRSEDGILDIEVRTPRSLGGPEGKYPNPEILFAGGYAACFDNALLSLIRAEKIKAGTTSVTAEVSLGKKEDGSYNLEITLAIEVPGVERTVAEDLAGKAHRVCPYSNAIRGNVAVTLLIK
ncbi:MAG: organic hydroperoxide resistance protein [Puia sp.]|nr:organic hydroperoxide resistance protein [Puia sp.]